MAPAKPRPGTQGTFEPSRDLCVAQIAPDKAREGRACLEVENLQLAQHMGLGAFTDVFILFCSKPLYEV